MLIRLFLISASFLFADTAFAKCLVAQQDGSVQIPTLQGYLLSEQEWELPAMKTQFTAWLLKLDQPITLCDPPFANQSKILDCVQVLLPNNNTLKKYHWQYIGVTGNANSFFENAPVELVTPIAVEATQLWMDPGRKPNPKELAELKKYRCRSTVWAEQRVGS